MKLRVRPLRQDLKEAREVSLTPALANLLSLCDVHFLGDEMPLIDQIFEATQKGDLIQPFTVEDLKSWMEAMHIVKDDGEPYAPSSIDAILSNSDRKNRPTSNKNRKVLQSRMVDGGKHEYWF